MGGVTHLAWHADHYVISGHRRDRYLHVWDLRKAGCEEEAQSALLHRFPRRAMTHQRFVFGTRGETLVTGDDSGDILFYDLLSLKQIGRLEEAHGRPCVSALLHPSSDLLLSASGSRCFPDYDVDSAAEPDSDSSTPCPVPRKRARTRLSGGRHHKQKMGRHSDLDNSLRIWRIAWA